MGENSRIAWTDATFNPWVGCTKISAGCANCYAERDRARFDAGRWGPGALRRLTSAANWAKPRTWARKALSASGRRPRVFCGSLCDYLDAEVPDLWREMLWDLIRATAADLDWLLLTKRADRLGIVPENVARRCWMGVTVENQATADERIPHLLRCPAAVRWVSMEPLLSATSVLGERERLIHWIVVGSESGPRRRPFEWQWAAALRDQCAAAGVAFFTKQGPDATGRITDDPARFPAGEWPREWPEVAP